MRVAIVAAVLCAAADAAADPCRPQPECEDVNDDTGVLHLTTPSTVTTDGGSFLRLPPGYFLPEDDWHALDLELKRAQDSEVRLTVENESLRSSAKSGAPWWAIGLGVAVGAVAGVYAYERWVD